MPDDGQMPTALLKISPPTSSKKHVDKNLRSPRDLELCQVLAYYPTPPTSASAAIHQGIHKPAERKKGGHQALE